MADTFDLRREYRCWELFQSELPGEMATALWLDRHRIAEHLCNALGPRVTLVLRAKRVVGAPADQGPLLPLVGEWSLDQHEKWRRPGSRERVSFASLLWFTHVAAEDRLIYHCALDWGVSLSRVITFPEFCTAGCSDLWLHRTRLGAHTESGPWSIEEIHTELLAVLDHYRAILTVLYLRRMIRQWRLQGIEGGQEE
ncbi:hypothetical protein SISSUDRAFT_1035760 [Sistotremastrum suecicum HHB10207 ss-3]|uniref:Uncharacterized protein n=1 Tax=Sistotremastrum suecicum HHB10207 ss-3 TaxID=1314776 RepID=A0A166AAR5_9AGAM|nr:hypothetical protein SISSUDRAFT_1035760 [Sistotremastrum suecicum HHB10207 ss-3]